MTAITTATHDTGRPSTFYAGRADAWDEHHAGTPLTALQTRLDMLVEYHLHGFYDRAYLAGYGGVVAEVELLEDAAAAALAADPEEQAQTAEETEWAYQERDALHRAQVAADLAAYRAERGEDR